jgi:acetate---CoA ligase (ADP-forming)
MNYQMANLKQLFYPKSVAVIGASRNEQKIGHLIFKNLVDSGFKGELYPINPKAKSVLGQPAFASILSLPRPADLAIVVVPANIVSAVLEEIGQSGTKIAIIISAGFAEANLTGQERQKELLSIAQKYRLRVLGPNCLGVINPSIGLNASWGETIPEEGNIALASQSGALAAPIIELVNEAGLGFSYFASLGNKVDINEVDLLEFFGQDKKTNLILVYLESFKNGRQLISLAQKITVRKPLIVLKSGQTKQGAKSAQSHTASLATPQRVTQGVLSQANIINADSVEEMINLAKLLTILKRKQVGPRVAIITNAGGPGVLATDAIVRNDLLLADISQRTIKKLEKFLPKAASLNNPIDILGDANKDTYFKTSQIILADDMVDNLIIILTKQSGTNVEAIAQELTKIKTKKLIIPLFMGGKSIKLAQKIFQTKGLTNFPSPQSAVVSLAKIIAWQKKTKRGTISNKTRINSKRVKKIFSLINQPRLTEAQGLEILSSCKIDTPKFVAFNSQRQGIKILGEIGYPAFLKVLSANLIHKTELGAVQKINSQKDFLKYFNIMKKNFNSPRFILSEAISGEMELIAGVKKDPILGHLLMIGAGGIYAEIWQDRSFRALPISENDAWEMIAELKIYPILKGARGKKNINLAEIEKTLLAIDKLIEAAPQIDQLDINPLIVGQKATAVDIKISLSPEN